jgi:hypothetical protein
VIGNLSGEIGVFKAQRKRPWKKCAGLGAVRCRSRLGYVLSPREWDPRFL